MIGSSILGCFPRWPTSVSNCHGWSRPAGQVSRGKGRRYPPCDRHRACVTIDRSGGGIDARSKQWAQEHTGRFKNTGEKHTAPRSTAEVQQHHQTARINVPTSLTQSEQSRGTAPPRWPQAEPSAGHNSGTGRCSHYDPAANKNLVRIRRIHQDERHSDGIGLPRIASPRLLPLPLANYAKVSFRLQTPPAHLVCAQGRRG